MWRGWRLTWLLPLQVRSSLREEHILREILVRFSYPSLTWRQSTITGVYIEEKKNPNNEYYYEEDPRIRLLFRSVNGKVYSKTLPASAVRWNLVTAIRAFYNEFSDAVESVPPTPPYCPLCGKQMIHVEEYGDTYKWRCPERHTSILPSILSGIVGDIGNPEEVVE